MQRVIELTSRLGVNGEEGLSCLDTVRKTDMQIDPGGGSLRRTCELGGLGQPPIVHGRDPASG